MTPYKRGILNIEKKQRMNIWTKKKEIYNDTIISFDIEVSSAWIDGDTPRQFDRTKGKSFYRDKEKTCICYIWQASIDDVVYYGRELKDFILFCNEILEKLKGNVCIWVHNLAYEFQFLCNYFIFDKVFARTPHHVIYAECFNGRLKFRCSFFLTRLSLAVWAKERNLPIKKIEVDDNYYDKIRTPLTILDKLDLEYSEHDCLVLYYGIMQYREKYRHLEEIPLTQTGEIRKRVKQIYHGNYKHFEKYTHLLPRNAREYARLKAVFAGGYTHANRLYTGLVLNDITSYDESSSYPTMMVAKKYPVSEWQKTSHYQDYLNNDGYVMLLDITFFDIESTLFNTYISYSKCEYCEFEKNTRDNLDNGRVIKAKILRITLTNVDFNIIKKSYKWQKIIVNEAWQAIAGYLPKDLIKLVLVAYSEKTRYKGLQDYQGTYMTQKQLVNSIFGMMVTAIFQEDVIFDNNYKTWSTQHLDIDAIDSKLNDLRKHKYKNYLSYAQGLFITAYARAALWDIIAGNESLGIESLDKMILYCDTDSVKLRGNFQSVFDKYNANIILELQESCNANDIDVDLLSPKSPDGKERQLGIYVKEDTYIEFVTLGAKRYAYRLEDGLHITVSGVNKHKGVKALNDDITNFNDNLVFSYDSSGKLELTYLDDMSKIVWNKGKYDEYDSDMQHGVCAFPTTYTMGNGIAFDEYIDMCLIAQQFKENFTGLSTKELINIARKNVSAAKQRED